MNLFGKKKKEETAGCCCGGNCTPETMAQAENAKKKEPLLRYWDPAVQNAISWKKRRGQRLNS